MYDFLRKIPLFADLPEEDLERLCEMIETMDLPAGVDLFAEGDPGDKAYVIQDGELEILKKSGDRTILLAVRGAGDVIGELALLEDKPRMASVRTHSECVLLAIGKEQLKHLLRTSPSAAEAMYYTILARWRNTESQLRQSEKMAQLGTLTAGIAHELNNPAAAVKRGADQLESAITELAYNYVLISQAKLSAEQRQALEELTNTCQQRASQPVYIDALTRSDREYELERWLDQQNIDNAWELAPALVDMEFEVTDLERITAQFDQSNMNFLFRWLNANFQAYSLLAELNQGATRISSIVKALKTYSYLDQAPIQAVNIHRGLDDTLLILNHKLKKGITVRREYDPDLPEIQAYGSELNQVWTNILDNAADALADKAPGEAVITIRTRSEEPWVVVEIEDNGPGIPEKIRDKIFHPFFTTKPPGQGTGLGLDISSNIITQKHRGHIKVKSEPGRTVFGIWLPIDPEERVITPLGS